MPSLSFRGFVFTMTGLLILVAALGISAAGQDEPNVDRGDKVITSHEDEGVSRLLEISARAEKNVYQQLERIEVQFSYKNADPEGREMWVLERSYQYKRVKAYWYPFGPELPQRAPQSLFLASKAYLPVGETGAGRSGNLKPNATRSGVLVANLANDMTATGDYTVVVEVDWGYYGGDGKWNPVVSHSNPVKIKIESLHSFPHAP